MLLVIAGILGLALFLGILMLFSEPIEDFTYVNVLTFIAFCIAASIAVVVTTLTFMFSIWAPVTGLGQVLG